MQEYHKINSIFKRDEQKNFIWGEFATPEIEYLRNNIWEWSEKFNGTNIRAMWDAEKGELKFGGKTDNSQMPVKLLYKLIEMFPKDKFINKPSLCLYGEGIGAGIEKGGGNYIKDGVGFILFDVLIDGWWLRRENVEEIAVELGVPIVPIIDEGTIAEAIEYTRTGFNSTWGNFIAEGLVLRPKVQMFARNGSRIITKVKYKDFIKKGK